MSNDTRLVIELLDLSVMLLICIIVGILITRGMYSKLRVEAPEKRVLNLIICVICALIAACTLFWFFLVLSTVFRGHWCEGCQEYH